MDVQPGTFNIYAYYVSDGSSLFGTMSKDDQLESGQEMDLSRTESEYAQNTEDLIGMSFFEKTDF